MSDLFFKLKVIVIGTWKSIFFLPGTFLHELSHFLVAKITLCKTSSFSSLIPIFEFGENRSYSITYGSVSVSPKIKAAYIFVGLSPLLLLIGVYYILDHIGFFVNQGNYYTINLSSLFNFKNIFWDLALIQLLSSCLPSRPDMKIFFVGLFSISGILLISLLIYGAAHFYLKQ